MTGMAVQVREQVAALLAERAASLLVIDGMHLLRAVTRSELAFCRFLNEIQSAATRGGTTTLLLANDDGASPRGCALHGAWP